MRDNTFRLLDAINREGLDNTQWGVVEDIESTKEYFGTNSDDQLKGKWLYIYRRDEDIMNYIWDTGIVPDIRDTLNWIDMIEFYKL